MARKKQNQRKKKHTVLATPRYHLPPTKHAEIAHAISTAQKFNQIGQAESAVELCLEAIKVEPKNAECYLTIAESYERLGQSENAHEAFNTAQKVFPNFVPGIVNHGLMLYSFKYLELSLKQYEYALAIDGNFLPALQGALSVLSDLRRYERAVIIAEKIARIRDVESDFIELARIKDLAGDQKGAQKTYLRVRSTSSNKSLIDTYLGLLALTHGDKTTAISYIKSALSSDSGTGYPYLYMAKSEPSSISLQDLEKTVSQSKDKSVLTVQVPMYFALAHLYEKAGDLEKAFINFSKANDLVCSIVRNDNEQRKQKAEMCWEKVEKIPFPNPKGVLSNKPVFVTGLPRSGTTLVESIIAAHSDAEGLGELELVPALVPSIDIENVNTITQAAQSYLKAYPKSLQHKLRLVDKSIGSVPHIGLILAMFPNAKIIICERHPMDTAWSAYKEYFSEGGLDFTYSFDRIATHQKNYAELMHHWYEKFPNRILSIRYEDLVNSPEKYAQQIISHVDLPWEQSCLDFHKSSHTVRTASVEQVRKPVYTSSIARWKPYEPWLGELKQRLSDLIKQYETE